MAYTTIDDSEAYFQVKLYTGNGSTQSLTLGGDTDMQPDFVWFKTRSGDAASHTLFDSVRGAQKRLNADSGNAESTLTTGLSSFDSDGFSIGSNADMNTDGVTHVAWCWKESATAGFDIVEADGTGSARTQAHSLSAVPEWIFVKELDNAGSWYTYTAMMGNEKAMFLNATNAVSGASSGYWNDTSPTNSVFSLGTDGGVNQSSTGYVFYLWRSVQGFSKFGFYSGNGNADGTFVYTGFRPATVILKNTSGTNGWEMRDNKRPGYNLSSGTLAPQSSDAETTGEGIDILSNGFKCRASGNGQNGSGNTYIYMAWAEAPFVNSNGVPCNAR